MKYRKLRIAWSVVWGIAAVLLIVLWVRSYSVGAYFIAPVAKKSLYCVAEEGDLRVLLFQEALAIRWDGGFRTPQESNVVAVVDGLGFRILYVKAFYLGFTVPYWFGLVICIALASWKGCIWRFSLRTLLIATTLVAIMLGAIVWLG